MFSDQNTDPQFFRLSDTDLETKQIIHNSEITSMTNAIKTHQKLLGQINHEVRLRQALRGEEITLDSDRCLTCKRSIQFEHPHDKDDSITLYGIRCPSLSVTQHIKNCLYLFGDKEKYNTARLLSVLTDLCDMTLYTVENFVTIMENLKDNKVIKYNEQKETWTLC